MEIVTIKNKKDWNDLLHRCKHVNMLQTWEYGEAKQVIEGWIPIRSLIDDGLSFLMYKYNQTMVEKNFTGPSEKLIRKIRDVALDQPSIQIMFAVKNGVRVGGILVVGSVDTCTYIIGWNSLEGRALCPNYFLLWKAILIFKRMGYRWFDLGGINEKTTPGITHFKRGLGGKEYTLIGEFEAFPKGMLSFLPKKVIKLGLKYRFARKRRS